MKIHGNPDCLRYKVLTSGSSANTGHLKSAATEVGGGGRKQYNEIQSDPLQWTLWHILPQALGLYPSDQSKKIEPMVS